MNTARSLAVVGAAAVMGGLAFASWAAFEARSTARENQAELAQLNGNGGLLSLESSPLAILLSRVEGLRQTTDSLDDRLDYLWQSDLEERLDDIATQLEDLSLQVGDVSGQVEDVCASLDAC